MAVIYFVENKEDVDIYVEYNVTVDSGSVEAPNCVDGEAYHTGLTADRKCKGIVQELNDEGSVCNSDSSNSDNDYLFEEDIQFDDSEEERMVDDDGFGHEVIHEDLIEDSGRWRQVIQVVQSDIPIEDGYNTEELDSASDSDTIEGYKGSYF
ncbi:hypothetical protein TSUD_136840 [Trifolium subterraneum]|uniref:Uncharacterized protein n=1 Tax=Trifolium subterraneum TaxID=3900 RepID=A0A2Z6NC89_TRISU|nr:hypothetical protein TSUD_136840 [Trifolium subterraneum]